MHRTFSRIDTILTQIIQIIEQNNRAKVQKEGDPKIKNKQKTPYQYTHKVKHNITT